MYSYWMLASILPSIMEIADKKSEIRGGSATGDRSHEWFMEAIQELEDSMYVVNVRVVPAPDLVCTYDM